MKKYINKQENKMRNKEKCTLKRRTEVLRRARSGRGETRTSGVVTGGRAGEGIRHGDGVRASNPS